MRNRNYALGVVTASGAIMAILAVQWLMQVLAGRGVPETPADSLPTINQSHTASGYPHAPLPGVTREARPRKEDEHDELAEYPRREVALVGDARFADIIGPGFAEEELDLDRLPPEMVSPLPMRMEAVALRAYKYALADPAFSPVEAGRDMLDSESATVRAVGAIWMIEQQRGLDASVMDRLIRDENAMVPLTALGWLRDMGLADLVDRFEQRWMNATEDKDRLVDYVRMETLAGIAGRNALYLLEASGLPEAEITELLHSIASVAGASYEVRWEAALLLMRHVDADDYQGMVAGLLDYPRTDTPEAAAAARKQKRELTDFDAAMMLLNERVSGPPVAMEQARVLTPDCADLFFAQESPLMLENVAMWVEAAVDRSLVTVKPGFTDALRSHLASYPEEVLPANQALTLRRIKSRLGELQRIEK